MSAFRVGFVPGVMPDKWKRTWAERRRRPLEMAVVDPARQEAVIRDGEVDMCLVRGAIDREGTHLIPLYVEEPVIVVANEHPAAAYDELELAATPYRRMVLEVNSEPANEPSLAFHRARGYVDVGTRGDPGHRVAMLSRELA